MSILHLKKHSSLLSYKEKKKWRSKKKKKEPPTMDRGIRGKTEKKHFATKAPLVGIRTSISERRGGREGEEERSPHPPLKKKKTVI